MVPQMSRRCRQTGDRQQLCARFERRFRHSNYKLFASSIQDIRMVTRLPLQHSLYSDAGCFFFFFNCLKSLTLKISNGLVKRVADVRVCLDVFGLDVITQPFAMRKESHVPLINVFAEVCEWGGLLG
ncbi:hypothetical protein CEXT_561411 [Caerostris extrusa]|uniref:Uncharacterized protein n=1 Tax=Caerostris extrusa TaxID=172846 RepID=A0AAV4TKK2_CAEEX|nr:hypothetical protein CEXT_561411 [Caerostris extrusa]